MKKIKKSTGSEKKLEEWTEDIPSLTMEQIINRTQLSRYLILKFCKKNNLKPKRKPRSKCLHQTTKERLDKIKNIQTSKKTQKQLAKILGFKGRASRQACSNFLKKHNILFKLSKKNSMTQDRLFIISEIKDIKSMDIQEIASKLLFDDKNAIQYTRRFLKQHNINIK